MGCVPHERLPEIGERALDLLLTAHQWVHRRVETLTFVDAGIVRRHLSVDLTIPADAPVLAQGHNGSSFHLLPVTCLPRLAGPMRFDACDGAGNRLRLLLASDNSRITAAALYAFAGRVLTPTYDDALDGRLGAALASIPTLEYPDALVRTRAILAPDRATPWTTLEREACNRLADDERFRDFLSLVTGNSLTMVPVRGEPGEPLLVKLAYDEEVLDADDARVVHDGSGLLPWLRRRRRALARQNPFTPETARVNFAAIGAAATFHVQILIPPHLEITSAHLRGWRPYHAIEPHVRPQAASERRSPDPCHETEHRGFASRAHLYLQRAEQLASGNVLVRLRSERHGLMTWAWLAAGVVSAMLLGYWRALERIVTDLDPGTAVLALAPGLVATYLVRPGEHALARNLLRWPRIMLGFSGLLALAAAACIVLMGSHDPEQILTLRDGRVLLTSAGPATDRLRNVMCALFFVSLVPVALLALWRVVPRPPCRSRVTHASAGSRRGTRRARPSPRP